MSLTTWDKFIPSVTPFVADCPGLVQIDALRKAAHDFCKETAAWSITNDPVSATANVAEYDLDSPSGAVIVALEGVLYNGVALTPKTPAQLDALLPNWAVATGTPSYYYRPSSASVVLVAMPEADAADAIVTRVAVAPDALTGTGVDSDISEKYIEAIAAGALARLLVMPGKWANPQMAQVYAGVFRAAKSDARAIAYTANSSAQLRVRGRRFI